MRREPDFFGDSELLLLYMARRLSDALRLEELLTAANIDYIVETGIYVAGFLLRRNLKGAFFYVDPATMVRAQNLLLQNRYKPYQEK
jgi:hypothetical protein